jgi:exo-1,4-beta-D-glucosaminidase
MASFKWLAGFVLLILSFSLRMVGADLSVAGGSELRQGWQLQSSADLGGATGEVLSTSSYRPGKPWHKITVPSTVVAALVKNGVLPEPYFGKNLRSFEGIGPVGKNFSNEPMPPGSPYLVPWWFRNQFEIPAVMAGKTLMLRFDGINYRANIWLNGQQIASEKEIAGPYRIYELDITKTALPGKENVLALEIFPPNTTDLAITFVDWNPTPPDKNMGLWRGVTLVANGPISIRHPFVESDIDLPGGERARLTVNADLQNHSPQAVNGLLRGTIGSVTFEKRIHLAGHERQSVEFAPARFPQLTLERPRLWWPAQMGDPNLYDLTLEFVIDGQVSDRSESRFGIRNVTSELNEKNHRVFKVNGKAILIRGGGWSSDMMLRPNPKRLEQEIRYAQDMGLNTIRLEGKFEPDEFFEITDRVGMLVIAGWCCCDHWEHWDKWKPQDHKIAEESQRSQVKRLRKHASMLLWMNASDMPPPQPVEQMYLGVLNECKWPNPHVSSATATPTQITGESGVKMTGPYDYVAPSYWLTDTKKGGAWGFNTETSPGPAIPPIESMRKMLPADKLWPLNDWWDYHAGGHEFKDIKRYLDAYEKRYGKSNSAEEFTAKSQAVSYEGIRAMFEAYNRNKYQSTGVVQWMLNNAWPGIIWHLYDYYLLPGGGYFGAKKANEPLHPMYSYDDGSVWLISSQYKDAPGLKVTARVLDLNMVEKFSQSTTIDAKADSANRLFSIPQQMQLTPTYFVVLKVDDAAGKRLSSNLYWLSTAKEELAWDKTEWYYTPIKSHADFTALNSLPRVRLKKSANVTRTGDEVHTVVTLENPGNSIAFLVRLQAKAGAKGEEILPVLWEDNYISLLPGEKRTIVARHAISDVGAVEPYVSISGWNVESD